MNVHYNDRADLFYIRLDETSQEILNRRVSKDIVLDIGKDEQIVGIEIMDASKRLDLRKLLPVTYSH